MSAYFFVVCGEFPEPPRYPKRFTRDKLRHDSKGMEHSYRRADVWPDINERRDAHVEARPSASLDFIWGEGLTAWKRIGELDLFEAFNPPYPSAPVPSSAAKQVVEESRPQPAKPEPRPEPARLELVRAETRPAAEPAPLPSPHPAVPAENERKIADATPPLARAEPMAVEQEIPEPAVLRSVAAAKPLPITHANLARETYSAAEPVVRESQANSRTGGR